MRGVQCITDYDLKEQVLLRDGSWDVRVVGDGSAGSEAADSAAREGASILLEEATGALGGMDVSGRVSTWYSFSDRVLSIFCMGSMEFDAARPGETLREHGAYLP